MRSTVPYTIRRNGIYYIQIRYHNPKKVLFRKSLKTRNPIDAFNMVSSYLCKNKTKFEGFLVATENFDSMEQKRIIESIVDDFKVKCNFAVESVRKLGKGNLHFLENGQNEDIFKNVEAYDNVRIRSYLYQIFICKLGHVELLIDGMYESLNLSERNKIILSNEFNRIAFIHMDMIRMYFKDQRDFISELKIEQLVKATIDKQKLSKIRHEHSSRDAVCLGISKKTLLFSDVYKEFIEFKKKNNNLNLKMQKEYDRFFIVWSLLVKDKEIDTYTSKDIGCFIDRCFELPRFNVSPYNRMSWNERIVAEVPEDKLISPKSVHAYYKWLQSVFAYAKNDKISYISVSPCSIKREFKAAVRGGFNDFELNKLLSYLATEKSNWKKWIVRLAIYTGARRGELYQLRREDIKFDNETSRYYLLVTDNHETQSLKTDNAKRRIPIHLDLIKMGFIEFVDGAEGKIFTELKNANSITGWFSRLMNNLKIEMINDLEQVRSFHSFRHTFISKLSAIHDLNHQVLQQLVGHQISNIGITGKYTHTVESIKGLIKIVDEFNVGK